MSWPSIIVPGAPLLVPQLCGAHGDQAATELRQAVLAAGRWLAERADTWLIVSAWRGPAGQIEDSVVPNVGTFAGFGVDVTVTVDPAGNSHTPDPMMPLPVLIGGWLRGQCEGTKLLRAIPCNLPAQSMSLAARGADRVGVVYVADGPNTLGPGAPGGNDDAAWAVFETIESAFTGAGSAELYALPSEALRSGADSAPEFVWGIAAHEMADATVDVLFRGAPFGVGYLVVTAAAR